MEFCPIFAVDSGHLLQGSRQAELVCRLFLTARETAGMAPRALAGLFLALQPISVSKGTRGSEIRLKTVPAIVIFGVNPRK
jgi:hypothetical protein